MPSDAHVNILSLEDDDQEDSMIRDGNLSHVVPEHTSNKWSHVKDLDVFFQQVYNYYNEKGYLCVVSQSLVEILEFIFIVILGVVVMFFVDYDVLSGDGRSKDKLVLADLFVPWSQAIGSINFICRFFLFCAFVFLCWKVYQLVKNYFDYKSIRDFYNVALQVEDSELQNKSWNEILTRLIDVQREHRMCVYTEELTELDIYNRILRYDNYLTAMVNKNLLPMYYNVPFLGNVCFFSSGLQYTLEFFFFNGPMSPFSKRYEISSEYLQASRQLHVAKQMEKNIKIFAIVNLILSPLIFVGQILHIFCSYAEYVRSGRGDILAKRVWSGFGKIYIRHFNELDHELKERLMKSYQPGVKYLESARNQLMDKFAHYIHFVFGTIGSLIFILGLYDTDALLIEHMVTIMAGSLGLAILAKSCWSSDAETVSPEQLLQRIVRHAHYLPDGWTGRANSAEVRKEFSHMLQLSASRIIEDLISPLVTPYILYFHLAPRSLEIVTFFKNFTVKLPNVGDVCSFAQMNVRKHGNHMFQPKEVDQSMDDENSVLGGKTELSLIYFSDKNPRWHPPQESMNFLQVFESYKQNAQSRHLPEHYTTASYDEGQFHNAFQPQSFDQSTAGSGSHYGFHASHPHTNGEHLANQCTASSHINFPNAADMYHMDSSAVDNSVLLLHNINHMNRSVDH